MEDNWIKLGLKKGASLDDIKRAYLKKVKEFTPEENQSLFIEIRRCYEEILEEVKGEGSQVNLIKKYFQDIKENAEIDNKCNLICKAMNIDNFKLVSDELVDLILYFNSLGYTDKSLMLIDLFIKEFQDIGLNKLANSYLTFRGVIDKSI